MSISERIKNHQSLNYFPLCPQYNINNSDMFIELTSKCNQSCIYCPFSQYGIHKNGRHIDDKLFYRVTKEAFDIGIKEIGLYSAGESFLNPKIYEYTKYLKNLGYKYVYISTNGILCNDENLIRLAEAGIDSIKFSIASIDRNNFKRHHGVDGFEIVKKNIINAYNFRKNNNYLYKLFLFFIVTKFNKHEKNNVMEIFGEYVDEILFDNVVIDNTLELKGVKEYLFVGANEFFKKGKERGLPCTDLWRVFSINADGYLCICCNTGSEMCRIADLNKTPLIEALHGKDFVNLRKKHIERDLKNTICNKCIYKTNEKIEPLSPGMGIPSKYINPVDITAEIKKRFYPEYVD